MSTSASCRGCAGRVRPPVQHLRCTRCRMTRCRARRTGSNCQVGTAAVPAYLGVGRLQRHDPPNAPSLAAGATCATGLPVTPTCQCAASMNTAASNLPLCRLPPGPCVPGRPAGRPGTQGCSILKAQTPEPRPHSQKTALPDSRSQIACRSSADRRSLKFFMGSALLENLRAAGQLVSLAAGRRETFAITALAVSVPSPGSSAGSPASGPCAAPAHPRGPALHSAQPQTRSNSRLQPTAPRCLRGHRAVRRRTLRPVSRQPQVVGQPLRQRP